MKNILFTIILLTATTASFSIDTSGINDFSIPNKSSDEIQKLINNLLTQFIVIQQENKEINTRLLNLEHNTVSKENFEKLKREFEVFKSKSCPSHLIKLNDDYDTLRQNSDSIEKSLTYLKQSQAKLEIKTVKIENELNGLNSRTNTEISDIRKESQEFTLASYKKLLMIKISISEIIVTKLKK